MDSLKKALLANFGHCETGKFIQDLSKYIQPQDNSDRTPLHFYAMYNEDHLALEYIRCGGDVNIRDKTGAIPIHYAVQYNSITCAELLLTKGADLNHKLDGQTAIDLARSKQHTEIMTLFEKYTICHESEFLPSSDGKTKNCSDCKKAMFSTCGCMMQNINSLFENLSGKIGSQKEEIERNRTVIERNQKEITRLNGQVPKIDKVEKDVCQLYFNSTVTQHNAPLSAVLVGIDYLPPKTREAFEQLQHNSKTICDHLDPSEVIAKMFTSGLLDDQQMQELDSFGSVTYKKVAYLMDLTLKHPKHMNGLRKAVKETGQKQIAELIPEVQI